MQYQIPSMGVSLRTVFSFFDNRMYFTQNNFSSNDLFALNRTSLEIQ